MFTLTFPFSSLRWRLFSYFSLSILVILIIATGIESLVVNRLLMLSNSTQTELIALAEQADELIKKQDITELAQWEKQQNFTLYVLDSNEKVVSGSEMHPHNRFKLNYLKALHQPMGDRVQRPLIGLPLKNRLRDNLALTLVVQLNPTLHPAQSLNGYLWLIRIAIGIAVIFVFSRLLTKYLIRPLEHLQSGSKALARGDLQTRISQNFSPKEREFYLLAAEFDEMAEQVERSIQNQQRLLRDVSHELRTPLARQELALHLLESQLKDVETPSLVQGLTRLRTERENMADLINSILNFSRLSNTYTKVIPAPFTLSEIRETILNDCGFEKLDGQTISWHMQADEQLNTDYQYLHRAIENIVRNSIKYAGENAHIQILAQPYIDNNQRWLTLSIQDNGQGICENKLANLFNPFTRIDDARHASQGGYGLGLAIVKQCMKLIGGQASASNLTSQGLKTTLCFPVDLLQQHHI